MGSYYYITTAPSVLNAVATWDAKRAAFHAQRIKLGQMFGGDASPMYSSSDNYVGGVKLSADRELDVHWRRPDEYGYRALRNAAKPEKSTPKEARAALKLEHERLVAQWKEHCPARISKDVGLYYVSECIKCGWVGSSGELTEDDAQCLQPVSDEHCWGDTDEIGADGKPFTKTQQVHMCGNSVSPPPMTAFARANDPWRVAERQTEAA